MLILTSCSSTKRFPAPPPLRASSVGARSLDGFAREWVSRVREAGRPYSAASLYGGLAVASARSAGERLGAPLHFVSAGMSIVSPGSRIPSYDLTLSGSAAIPTPIRTGGATSSAWWASLNQAFERHQPMAALVRRHADLALVALPATYLKMVEPELLSLGQAQIKKLRIVMAENPELAPALEAQVVRYDQRFQTTPGAPRGALASFVQRALSHFSDLLADNPRIRSIGSQRRLVEAALSHSVEVAKALGAVQTDEQVMAWVARVDPQCALSRSTLLSRFRGHGRACEHGRFFSIVDRLRA